MVNIRTSRSWIEVDLDMITYNIQQLKTLINKKTKFMAVVKAEAYGHGLVEVARHCQKIGIEAFGVATIDEGIKLREHGIYGEILILGYTHPVRAIELHNYRLIQTVVNREHAYQLNESGYLIDVHIKVDTGMHRLGFDLRDYESIKEIYEYQFIHIQGYFTHLCVCDSKRKADINYTIKQIQQFDDLINELKLRHYDTGKIHLQSSYGLVNYPEIAADYVRIGILMYGVQSTSKDYLKTSLSLKPALKLKAQIAMLHYLSKGTGLGYGLTYKVNRDSVIAVIPIGYGDGLPRILSSNGNVLIRGQECPIVGRICMDQMLVDVSEISEINDDDLVTIIGQDGTKEIRVEEIALEARTISNEILSRLGNRLPRVYKGGQ